MLLVAVVHRSKKQLHMGAKELSSDTKDPEDRVGSTPTAPLMAEPTKAQKRDHEIYFLDKPEDDFSEAHNKAVVENSIKKYEAKQRKMVSEFRDAAMERADAVISYIRAVDRGGSNTNLDGYFTRQHIAMLQGRDLQAKIMEGLTIIRNKKKIQNAEKKYQRIRS